MSTIISFKSKWVKDGILKSSILPFVWCEFQLYSKRIFRKGVADPCRKHFPSETHTGLLAVLRRFDIIFPLKDKDEYIVPCLLSDEGPRLHSHICPR